MYTPLFILSFTFYLLSLVLALAATIFSRTIPRVFINITIAIHFLFLLAYVILIPQIGSIEHPTYRNYVFLFFFCLGILTAGLTVRNKYPALLKFYFMLFLLSLPIFIVSPSRVLGFIVTGDINAIQRDRIHVKGNYFLVAQSHHRDSAIHSQAYKLIREIGIFHRTMQRDIILPGICDSVYVIGQQPDFVNVRLFYSNDKTADSIDRILSLIPVRDSSKVITKKP